MTDTSSHKQQWMLLPSEGASNTAGSMGAPCTWPGTYSIAQFAPVLKEVKNHVANDAGDTLICAPDNHIVATYSQDKKNMMIVQCERTYILVSSFWLSEGSWDKGEHLQTFFSNINVISTFDPLPQNKCYHLWQKNSSQWLNGISLWQQEKSCINFIHRWTWQRRRYFNFFLPFMLLLIQPFLLITMTKYQRTRMQTLTRWHDHDTVLSRGYILITVHVLYDDTVILTSAECKVPSYLFVYCGIALKNQKYTWSPSVADQAALIPDCIQSIHLSAMEFGLWSSAVLYRWASSPKLWTRNQKGEYLQMWWLWVS